MSAFDCAHGERYELFGTGGGRRLADEVGAPLLASIPLEPAVALGGDLGATRCARPDNPEQARRSSPWSTPSSNVAPPSQMTTCSARVLEALEASGPAGRPLSRAPTPA